MKANGAPEKIYACFGVFGLIQATEIRVTSKDVEYTRTDAFIEKVCEFLQINLWRVANEEPDFRQRFVTDFRNHMKGE